MAPKVMVLGALLTAVVVIAYLVATGDGEMPAPASKPCTDAWYRSVDARVPSGDGQGHGPDIGSDEWKSVIEFRLGVRGHAGVPARTSPQWCRYIDEAIVTRASTADDAIYRRRIAALDIRTGLLRPLGPIRWVCDGRGGDLAATFYDTDPKSVVIERAGTSETLFAEPGTDGIRYAGSDRVFWQRGIEATVTWGRDAPSVECRSTL